MLGPHPRSIMWMWSQGWEPLTQTHSSLGTGLLQIKSVGERGSGPERISDRYWECLMQYPSCLGSSPSYYLAPGIQGAHLSLAPCPLPLHGPLPFSVMAWVLRQTVMLLERKAFYLPSIWHNLLLTADAFRSESEALYLPSCLPSRSFQGPGLKDRWGGGPIGRNPPLPLDAASACFSRSLLGNSHPGPFSCALSGILWDSLL